MADSQSIYPLDSSLTLAAAGPKWLAAHQQFIQANTLKGYRNSVRLLLNRMGELALTDIRIEHIRAYQAERSKVAGSYLINGELSVLQMILKQAGQWPRMREFYKPLRVRTRGAGHSLKSGRRGQVTRGGVQQAKVAPGSPLRNDYAQHDLRIRRNTSAPAPRCGRRETLDPGAGRREK